MIKKEKPISFLGTVKSLFSRSDELKEREEINAKQEEIASKINFLKQVSSFLQPGTEKGDRAGYDVETLVYWVNFLNSELAEQLPEEIKQLIAEIPETDENELSAAESFLRQQAEQRGLSSEEMLVDWTKSEDPLIKERITGLQEFQTARTKLEALKPKLREFALATIEKLQRVAADERSASADELRVLAERFQEMARPAEDYESYAAWLGTRFLSRVINKEYLSSEINSCDKFLNGIHEKPDGYGRKYNKEEMEVSEETIELIRNSKDICQRKLRVEQCLWQDFWENYRRVVEKKLDDPSKRKNLLERLSGATEPAFELKENFHGFIIDPALTKEIGEAEMKQVVGQFIRTRFLANLTTIDEKGFSSYDLHYRKEGGEDTLRYQIEKAKDLRDLYVFQKELADGTYKDRERHKYEDTISGFVGLTETFAGDENKIRDYRRQILALAETDVVFLNQIGAVIRARGGSEKVCSPCYHEITDHRWVPGILLQASGEKKPDNSVSNLGNWGDFNLQRREGILFESADDYQKITEEVRIFTQKLSDAINNDLPPAEETAFTPADARRLANEAVSRARNQAGVDREERIKAERFAEETQADVISSGNKLKNLELEANNLKRQMKDLTAENSRLRQEISVQKREKEESKDDAERLRRDLKIAESSLEKASLVIQEVKETAAGEIGWRQRGAVIKKIKDCVSEF